MNAASCPATYPVLCSALSFVLSFCYSIQFPGVMTTQRTRTPTKAYLAYIEQLKDEDEKDEDEKEEDIYFDE